MISFRHAIAATLLRSLARRLVRRDAARIGRRIGERRRSLGMEPAALARCAGLAEADVRRWEAGDLRGLGSDALEVMRKSLRCTPSWLLAGAIHPGEYGEALCLDRVIPVIGHFEELPPATRRRLVRFLVFVVMSGDEPLSPGRREVVAVNEGVEGIGATEP
ncbi:hypothetical protein [Endothiovibrio diazotrophicus]